MTTMPKPIIDNWNRPFWDACADRRLIVQRCQETGKTWLPPSPISPFAPAAKWEWTECSGAGTVLSWIVFHQVYFSGFSDRAPYNVALVRLDEGATMLSNVLGGNDNIEIGQRVTVDWEMRENFNVPVFNRIVG